MSVKAFVKKGLQPGTAGNGGGASKEWELRPGGMLVQKRDPHADASHAGPLINVKVSYGLMYHHVSIPANSTFGDLKKLLVQDSGLQTKQQRLLYKGKEKNDSDCLCEAGVKDKSKVVLVEDTASWEKSLIESRKKEAASKACKAVAEVQQLVDKVSGQIASIESAVNHGTKQSDSEFSSLIDLLMYQLLKLDANKVEGDARVKQRILIRRVQKYVETLDVLILKNNALKSQKDISSVQTNAAKATINTLRARINDISSVQTNAAKVSTNTLRARINARSSANSTVVTTAWETFGNNFSNHHPKSTPSLVPEPMLIQWD